MLARDEAMRIAESVLSAAGGDGEATVSTEVSALLRFAGGQPVGHSTRREVTVGLRYRDGDRLGEAQVQGVDEGAIEKLVNAARHQAELLPPDPEPLPSLGPQPLLNVTAHHADTTPDACDAELRAELAEQLAAVAVASGADAAGIVTVSEGSVVRATTHGMRGSYASTEIALEVTVDTGESSGRAEAWSRSRAAVDAAALGREAAETAARGRGARGLDPGVYRVVLAPAAVATCLRYLAGGFNARQVLEQRSYLTGKIGQKLFGDNVRIRTDVCHPLLQGCPFDGDSLALRRVELVRDGVAAALLHDRRTAVAMGAEPTGWSSGGRSLGGAGASALVMDGGSAGFDDLLAACGDGVYVSRLWYTNWVDPKACVITGMTRDGTFRIRDGKLAEPVRNLRVIQNLVDLFSGIEALGRPVAVSGVVAPPLAAKALSFSTGTSF